MVLDPASITLAIAAITAAAKGGGAILGAKKEKKFAKKKSKELKRSTYADLLNSALQKGADIESMGLDTSAKRSRRKTNALMNTAAGVRESFNI